MVVRKREGRREREEGHPPGCLARPAMWDMQLLNFLLHLLPPSLHPSILFLSSSFLPPFILFLSFLLPPPRHELATWLALFKTSLGLRDESPLPNPMPLKGLPKQKFLRRDFSVRGRIEEGVVYTKALVTKETGSEVAREPDTVETPESIKFLSFRTLS